MSEPTNTNDAAALGGKILAQLKDLLGSDWAGRLGQADRDLLEAVSVDAGAVLLLGLTAAPEVAQREKAHVDAQLLNVASVEAEWASRQLWAAAGIVVKAAAGFALALA